MKKLLVFLMMPFLLVSCISGIEIPEDKKNYVGKWYGEGISLSINEYGFVDYEKSEGSRRISISGPIQSFKDEDFKVGILFLNTTFYLEQEPIENSDGQLEMILDGHTLVKIGGFQTLEIPSDDVLNELIQDTLNMFKQSIDKSDFSILYNEISSLWKHQTSIEELSSAFVTRKEEERLLWLKMLSGDIVIDNNPVIDDNSGLVLRGYIVSEDGKLHFDLYYLYEYPTWKLFGMTIE